MSLVQLNLEKLVTKLPRAFDETYLIRELARLQEESNPPLSDTTCWRIKELAKPIDIDWNKRVIRQLYSFEKGNFEPIELAAAWTRAGTFLSHYSALYWNEIIEQKPEEYHLSTEVRSHTNSKGNDPITETLLRMAFMKDPRFTQNFATWERTKFYFIERANSNETGIIEKTISVRGRKVTFKCSDIERTLLDSIIAPHYAGGMTTVMKAFREADIRLEKLREYYDAAKVLYPFWQRIGFVLDLTKGDTMSEKWRRYFGDPKLDFFYDRNARNDWLRSEKWRILYPKGLALK